jgi:hypothetical protein
VVPRLASGAAAPTGHTFGGHVSDEFAYGDEDRPEALQERIDLSTAATLGPTRVCLDRVGDIVVGSTMVIDPEGHRPHEDQIVS